MTRRERLERKAERRRKWAAGAEAEAQGRFAAAGKIADQIPLGQPILVGHHSEKQARRDRDRITAHMGKGFEAQARAAHHRDAAGGLEAALDRSIFSDDADALEQLRSRIAEKEAKAQRIKALNAAIRRERKRGDGWLDRVGATAEELAAIRRNVEFDWRHEPTFPTYVLSNLRGSIRADADRLRAIEERARRVAEAEAAGGVVVKTQGDYASVTFASKPARDVLGALKAAGFFWTNGSWHGKAENLPPEVRR